MISLPGWTWDDVLDQLTTSRIAALRRAWKLHPPVHKMLAAFAGYKPATEAPKIEPMTAAAAEALIRYSGGRLI